MPLQRFSGMKHPSFRALSLGIRSQLTQEAARSALAVIRSRFDATMVQLQQQAAQHASVDPCPSHRKTIATPPPSALNDTARQRSATPAEGASVKRRSSMAASNAAGAAAAAVVASQLLQPFQSGIHIRSTNSSLNPSNGGGALDLDPAAQGSPMQRALLPGCVLERGHLQLNFIQQQQQQRLEEGWRQGGAGDSDSAGDHGTGNGDRTSQQKQQGSNGNSSGGGLSRRPTSASRRVSFASETTTD